MDQLFPFQKEGASFLAENKIGMLADEMGLGKTLQALHGLDRIHAKERVLIICPSIARINWLRELQKWSEIKRDYVILTKLSDKIPPGHSAICSFDYASSNSEYLKSIKWEAQIYDECHFLKNHTAKRSKAIIGKNGIIHSTDYAWFLSGTPAPNNPAELWVFLWITGRTKLSYDKFVERFCKYTPTSYGLNIHGANRMAIPELRALLKPVMLRRLKKDVMKELPPISYSSYNIQPGLVDLEIQASFTQYFIPDDKRAELFEKIEKERDLLDMVFNNTKGREERLTAIANVSKSIATLRRYNGLQKVDSSVQFVKNIFINKTASKVVIFALHRDVIEGLREGLREFNPQIIYGGTPPKKRQRRIDKFQTDKSAKVFIGNIMAAGTAITLTAAHYVIFVEQDWVPGNNAQAVMRCHRYGQENPVSVKVLTLDGTLDSQIDNILKNKTNDLTQIFD